MYECHCGEYVNFSLEPSLLTEMTYKLLSKGHDVKLVKGIVKYMRTKIENFMDLIYYISKSKNGKWNHHFISKNENKKCKICGESYIKHKESINGRKAFSLERKSKNLINEKRRILKKRSKSEKCKNILDIKKRKELKGCLICKEYCIDIQQLYKAYPFELKNLPILDKNEESIKVDEFQLENQFMKSNSFSNDHIKNNYTLNIEDTDESNKQEMSSSKKIQFNDDNDIHLSHSFDIDNKSKKSINNISNKHANSNLFDIAINSEKNTIFNDNSNIILSLPSKLEF